MTTGTLEKPVRKSKGQQIKEEAAADPAVLNKRSAALDKAARALKKIDAEITEINRDAEAAVKILKLQRAKLVAGVMGYLENEGQRSCVTVSGIALKMVNKVIVRVTEWPAFYKYIMENGRIDLLQKRVASTEFKESFGYDDEATLEQLADKCPAGTMFHRERELSITKA